MTIYRIKDTNVFCEHIAEYTNGILTTAGLYPEDQLIKTDAPVIGITYAAECCTELPMNWYDKEVLDDRDKRLKIKDIDFGSDTPYIMEDGHKSKEVTL